MHRLPRFFSPSHKDTNHMDSSSSKHKSRAPKLERRLAKKNIDYDPSSSSSSSSSSFSASEQTAALRTRSLDLSPFGDRTSFRVQGIDGEFDLICQHLGLSVDDFTIPVAAWEARKALSSSDLLPRSRLQKLGIKFDSSNSDTTPPPAPSPSPSPSPSPPPPPPQQQCESAADDDDVCELSDRLGDSVRVRVHNDLPDSVESFSRGIKGVRPPVLAPPPLISLPVIDNTSSTWDILRSFAPEGDGDWCSLRGFVSSDDENEEEQEEEEIVNPVEVNDGVRLGVTAVHSESCSFTTTSNDEDSPSSSTTTDPMNISPNGRFRRVITYWEKGELLGRGSFGSVYEGIAAGGFFIAVKEVSLLDQGDQGRQSVYQLEQEIALLSQFEHENIVQYYGTDKDESKLYIFLELVTKGSLLSLYQKYNLQDSQVSSYTRQILRGLKYLHKRNVVHRDIKCANILVDANGSVKLADFGLAKATKLNDVKSCKGTAFWMAPEVVNRRNQGYGLAADIWSLGCTVLEMLTRQIPYSNLECMQALFRIGRGEPPHVPDSLSRDARKFILKCLKVDPDARPTAAQLLDDPFVRRPLSTSSGSESPYSSGQRV